MTAITVEHGVRFWWDGRNLMQQVFLLTHEPNWGESSGDLIMGVFSTAAGAQAAAEAHNEQPLAWTEGYKGTTQSAVGPRGKYVIQEYTLDESLYSDEVSGA